MSLERELKDAIAAIVFEPGKSYIVLVAADAIDAQVLATLPVGPDCTFVFVYPIPGKAVWEMACRMEVGPRSVVFVDDACLDKATVVEGVKFVRVFVPPGKKLRDVMTEPGSVYQRMIEDSVRVEERERCAKVAEGYQLSADRTCENACGPAIALRIRSGQ